jgi:hypothetical protein
MHQALDVVAQGDHSEEALDELFASCQDWKKAHPKMTTMAQMPHSNWGKAPPLLPTTSILFALRWEDWEGLKRQAREWKWEKELT